ncbi:MAG: caspase family protein [Salinivirgaceae bacterium]|nr:caspase family protein [Salinivirgaceae bacterium]
MKKIHSLFFFLFALSILSFSQNIEIVKEKALHGKDRIDYKTIINLGEHGYILGGYTLNTPKGDPDFLVTKVDENYNEIWSKVFGETKNDKLITSCLSADKKNFLFVGISIDEVNNYAQFVGILLDENGKLKWQRSFMGNPQDKLHKVIVSADEGYAVVGTRESKGDHDLNLWVMKIDKRGNKLWQGYFGERFFNDQGFDIIETPDQGFLATGSTMNSTKDNHDVLLVKIDKRGNEEWKKTYGGSKTDVGLKLLSKGNDDFLLAGLTASKGNGGNDIWVLSLDKFGNKMWDKTYGSYHEDSLILLMPIEKDKFILSSVANGNPIIYVVSGKGDILSENYLKAYNNIEIADIIMANDNQLLFFANSSKDINVKDRLLYAEFTETKTDNVVREDIKDDQRGFIAVSNDKVAPKIEITFPILNYNYAAIKGSSNINIKGIVSDESGIANLYINNESQSFSNAGYFDIKYNLKAGYNDIFIKVADINGNVTEEHVTLEFTNQTSENSINENIGKYYALLISVNNYADDAINDLDNPISDGQKLNDVLLSKYSFSQENINFLKDPTRSDIILALEDYAQKLTPDDNLLIFYAGHGHWDPQTETGFWLPSDARKANTANWLRNSTLRDFINGIKSKHTLLIADACFSGGIFKTRSAFSDADKSINKLYEVPSRKAMTSGTLKEVPDKSVFIEYLVKRLENNNKSYISSEELFVSFKAAVLNNSPNIPQYGEIKNTGDEGGDFIFILKK